MYRRVASSSIAIRLISHAALRSPQRSPAPSRAIGTPALYDQQAIEPFPQVVIGNSPYSAVGYGFRYGLTAWLECSTPATGCEVVSSPGAFGWTPWVDREHGYYAVLGMEIPPTGGPGVVSYAVSLAQALKPAILTALAP